MLYGIALVDKTMGIGDFDGDGAQDLALGAETYGNGYASDANRGAVLIVNSGSISGTLDLALADGQLEGTTPGDNVGGSVTARDLDGDGKDDLIVGAAGASVYGQHSGIAYVVYGPLATFAPVEDVAAARVLGDTTNWMIGWSVDAGDDLTGDGVVDLVFGALQADGDAAQSGAVLVVPGR